MFSKIELPRRLVSKLSKIRRKPPKRKREDLGKVVSFAFQELEQPLEAETSAGEDPEGVEIMVCGAGQVAEAAGKTEGGSQNPGNSSEPDLLEEAGEPKE